MAVESILNAVKSYVGIQEDDTSFDPDLIMAINAVMTVLYQLGVGPTDAPFVVEDEGDEWDDLLGEDPIGGVREYVNMRVRLLFDPPSNPQLMQALNDQIDEFEWRLIAEVDRKAYEGVTS